MKMLSKETSILDKSEGDWEINSRCAASRQALPWGTVRKPPGTALCAIEFPEHKRVFSGSDSHDGMDDGALPR